MPLPKVPLATGSVNLGGTDVPIRALSRLEVLRVSEMENIQAEPYILSCAAGVSLEEATEWLGSVSAETGNTIAAAVLRLSGTGEGDPADPSVGSTGAGPTAPPSNEP